METWQKDVAAACQQKHNAADVISDGVFVSRDDQRLLICFHGMVFGSDRRTRGCGNKLKDAKSSNDVAKMQHDLLFSGHRNRPRKLNSSHALRSETEGSRSGRCGCADTRRVLYTI